jgi:hypothetical protein
MSILFYVWLVGFVLFGTLFVCVANMDVPTHLKKTFSWMQLVALLVALLIALIWPLSIPGFFLWFLYVYFRLR